MFELGLGTVDWTPPLCWMLTCLTFVNQIHNAYPHEWTPLDEAWPRTYDNLGIGMISDERDGLALGGYNIQTNLNLDNNTRSYSGTSYLNPIRYRPNLKVYTHALVTKVNFEEIGGSQSACSVSFTMDQTDYSIAANQEVIVSGGSIGSPQILELSGIGDPALLKSHGISTVHGNSYVGENFQDHLLLNIVSERLVHSALQPIHPLIT